MNRRREIWITSSYDRFDGNFPAGEFHYAESLGRLLNVRQRSPQSGRCCSAGWKKRKRASGLPRLPAHPPQSGSLRLRDSTASTVDKSFLSITCDFLWMTAPDTAKTEPALITCLTNSRITGRHAIGSLSRLQCVGEPFLFLVSRPVCTLDEFVGLINESGSLPL
jgi:hypothetical protein